METTFHGYMKYRCPVCGSERFVVLDRGVEEDDVVARPRQPSPFLIPCTSQFCEGVQQDISGLHKVPTPQPLKFGMWYFEYNHTGECASLKRFLGSGRFA